MTLINHIKMTARLWWQAWLLIGAVLNWVMTRVILIVLFFVILTPMALIARALGKRFLIPTDRACESYWQKRAQEPFRKEIYEHQF